MLRRSTISILVTLMLATGCGDDDPGQTNTTGSLTPCTPGEQQPCSCEDGTEALSTCPPDGAGFGVCGPCNMSEPTTGGPATGTADTGDDVCGDTVCDVWETCENCPDDCGVCEMCDLAPKCAGNVQPPTITIEMGELTDTAQALTIDEQKFFLAAEVEAASPAMRLLAHALASPRKLDDPRVVELRAAFAAHSELRQRLATNLARLGMPTFDLYRDLYPLDLAAASVTSPARLQTACENPRLRIRVASVTVHEEYDDFNNDYVYCMITTEAESQGEVRVTPIYETGLAAGSTYPFSIAEGVVWGVDNQLVPPGGNMRLTYRCYENDDWAAFEALLDAIAMAVDGLGGLPVPGGEGWVLPAGQVADLISQILQLDGDNQLFNASQTIDEHLLLTLTQGRYWTVRRYGSVNLSDWDWELRMEAWGCTDDGTL
jgi:hypothetical protein